MNAQVKKIREISILDIAAVGGKNSSEAGWLNNLLFAGAELKIR